MDGNDEQWHTIVNVVFWPDPSLQPLIDQGRNHEEVLGQDTSYTNLISKISAQLRSGRLRKWKTSSAYQASFCRTFASIQVGCEMLVAACSFQEKTLRASKRALLQAYNDHIGGIEGRGIGFAEFTDAKGRLQVKHCFLNFHGYHEIQASENKMLVLLLMSWFIADQFRFYFNDIVRRGRRGCDGLALTVVSDKLSGDTTLRTESEQNLRNLIDPEGAHTPVVLTRSATSDTFSGDLVVDNLAGWLNSAISNPAGKHAEFARSLVPTGVWTGGMSCYLPRLVWCVFRQYFG